LRSIDCTSAPRSIFSGDTIRGWIVTSEYNAQRAARTSEAAKTNV
jgi:hypothetical protein